MSARRTVVELNFFRWLHRRLAIVRDQIREQVFVDLEVLEIMSMVLAGAAIINATSWMWFLWTMTPWWVLIPLATVGLVVGAKLSHGRTLFALVGTASAFVYPVLIATAGTLAVAAILWWIGANFVELVQMIGGKKDDAP